MDCGNAELNPSHTDLAVLDVDEHRKLGTSFFGRGG
jgi:hypothetical protein